MVGKPGFPQRNLRSWHGAADVLSIIVASRPPAGVYLPRSRTLVDATFAGERQII